MASDTVPAAVPGPTDPPHSTAPAPDGAQQPGGLAGLLAPVQSPRAAFSLDPTPAENSTLAHETTTDISSTAFDTGNGTENTPGKNETGSGGKQEKSVIRAWMLAGAERWRKAGDARLKALDLRKEQAKARQVKETVTVNRSEKVGDGPTSSGTGSRTNNGGKSLASKSSGGGNGAGTGPRKNNSGGAGNHSGNRSGGGSGGSHHSGGGSNGAGPKSSSGTDRASSGKDRSPRGGMGKDQAGHGKQPTPGTASGHGHGHGGKADLRKAPHDSSRKTPGSGGGAGKPGGQGPAGKPTGMKDQVKPTPQDANASTKKPTGPSTQPGTGDSGKPYKQADATKNPGPNAASPKAPQNSPKPGPAAPPGTLGKGLWKSHFSRKPEIGPNKELRKDVNVGPRPNGRTPTPRINLQSSREAGYRDGTRAAKTAAHTRAWRDGVRDGWTDTRQAADRETRRLDQAHADRKQKRAETTSTRIPPKPTHPPKPTAPPTNGPKPAPATTPTPQKPKEPSAVPTPQKASLLTPPADALDNPPPVFVDSVDATHVHLAPGAARPTISRGEVRTLKSFERRLGAKAADMTTATETAKVLEAHADAQTKRATHLLEAAQSVEGGDKLIAELAKLSEASTVQANEARELHKRAARATEACNVLYTNVTNRYGDMYRAVVNSPLTAPAELRFYKG